MQTVCPVSIRVRRPSCRARAFTLVELLVALGIVAVLVAILLPVFFSARAKAHTTECAANLRQIGIALQSYVQDYDATYPPLVEAPVVNHQVDEEAPYWEDLIFPYIKGAFPHCPNRTIPPADETLSKNDTRLCGYGYNTNLAGATYPSPDRVVTYGAAENIVSNPALFVAVFDSRIGSVGRLDPDLGELEAAFNAPPGAMRHQAGANYLFADGHVKWYLPASLATSPDVGAKGDGIHPGFGL